MGGIALGIFGILVMLIGLVLTFVFSTMGVPCEPPYSTVVGATFIGGAIMTVVGCVLI